MQYYKLSKDFGKKEVNWRTYFVAATDRFRIEVNMSDRKSEKTILNDVRRIPGLEVAVN